MNKQINIPKEDLEAINRSFAKTSDAQTIVKDGWGSQIRPEKKLVNDRSFVFSDFRGRKLRHAKIVIPERGKQVTVGVQGDLFDDIPVELRKLVPWFESDFE